MLDVDIFLISSATITIYYHHNLRILSFLPALLTLVSLKSFQNTFQLALATDGSETYAIFRYTDVTLNHAVVNATFWSIFCINMFSFHLIHSN